MPAVAAAYTEEAQRRPQSALQRRAERIERLLAGEPLGTSGLGYDFAGWNLGVIVAGSEAEETIRSIAEGLDCRLLFLVHEPASGAWLGTRNRLDSAELLERTAPHTSGRMIAIGEPAKGLAGWRLTHRQAAAALPVAKRRGRGAVRYADVALLAAALQDDLLTSSLYQLYLRPLEEERDSAALCETLRAYLAAGGSLSSAAIKLGVSRRTVANRLHRVEDRIGHPLHTRLADVETALRLERLERGYGRIPN